MVTRLILLRHGITRWNIEKRYCGYKDVPLAREGKAQAALLRQGLKGITFDRIYSSDKKRAIETARILFDGARIIKVKGLREISFGVMEGLRHRQILKKYPGAYGKWLADPFRRHMPKAEAMGAFKKRVFGAIHGIVSVNPGKTVAVVCHGGTISIFISGILKKKDFWRYIPRAASASIVEYRKGKPRIKQFNQRGRVWVK